MKDDFIFLQDNDPRHVAWLILDYVRGEEISLLPIPPYSPDVNIIENWFHCLKKEVYREKWKYTSLQELKQGVHKIVRKLSRNTELNRALVDSIPQRPQSIIENKGYYTKY